jgi:aldose 1-epimerase
MKSEPEYKLDRTIIDNLEIIRIAHLRKDSWFSLIPGYGGALNAFFINGHEILLAANTEEELKLQTIKSYAGAQLFPYPNRIKDAQYTFLENTYSLPVNEISLNNSLHGLIYNRPFEVDLIDEASGLVKLSYHYVKEHAGYPFDVAIHNRYQLAENALTITTTIENRGTVYIPVGHGWHPYFVAPKKVDNCLLQIPGNESFIIDDDLIPTGEVERLDNFTKLNPVGSMELNHCFKLSNEKSSQIKLVHPDENITIKIITEGYPYLQLYTPPKRDSIAIEPQSCAPDAFNNKIGCLYLNPNESLHFKLQIDVEL